MHYTGIHDYNPQVNIC